MWLFALTLLLCGCRVYAKPNAVFAHFMVTNTQNYSSSDWLDDISKAKAAHIDAFALNMAVGDPANTPGLSAGFRAANQLGFKLFFSFDYAGNGPWKQADVIGLIQQYGSNGAYYQYQNKPFVSTFEGPANANDWKTIKQQTGCFFIPSWSSLGAKNAVALGVADGQFSWASWPWGNRDMTTYVDASYIEFLKGQPYMMLVSPWFYTNLPGYNKNWLWRGDDLWFDRWQEVLTLQPDFVEIGTWNDYGESHYIGPVRSNAFAAFNIGRGPFNYAAGMPHDGWRTHLPFLIDLYKTGNAKITQESLVSWYRLQPAAACSNGGTTGNTASQLQVEFDPIDVVQDRVFYTALLGSTASVTISIGGVVQSGTWSTTPDGGIGLYHGSVPLNGHTGQVIVTVSRSGQTVAQMAGQSITTTCASNGLANYNAWVGSATSSKQISATPKLPISKQVCINGTAPGAPSTFQDMCSFTCGLGYCPSSACVCHELGAPPTMPPSTGPVGYPLDGGDPSFLGLCNFACTHGHCPSNICQTTNPNPNLVVPDVSPFLPPAPTAGTGADDFAGLCSYSCNTGFCPRAVCSTTGQGALNVPSAPISGIAARSARAPDAGLCEFACTRPDYCPDPCLYNSLNGYYPRSFAAFGDSFSAGHGAGFWLSVSKDNRDNECARGDGSYPWMFARKWIDQTQSRAFFKDFWSCTGAVISDIAGQVSSFRSSNLPGFAVDRALLSISGNNFGFGDVVRACVYPWGRPFSNFNFQEACDNALDSAEAMINNDDIYSAYRDALVNIADNTVLGGTGTRVFITGYAQFFSSSINTNDVCDNTYFLNDGYIGKWLKMTTTTRSRMNGLVQKVNQNIQSKVVDQVADTVFIDIDPDYEGHRFCEPENKDPKCLSGHGSADCSKEVYFLDLDSNLDEEGTWNGPPAHSAEFAAWDAWSQGIPSNQSSTAADSGYPADDPDFAKRSTWFDKFQQAASFHPTEHGHEQTVLRIMVKMLLEANSDPRQLLGPTQFCTGLGTGEGTNSCQDVPEGCVAMRPLDSSLPTVYCTNGTVIP